MNIITQKNHLMCGLRRHLELCDNNSTNRNRNVTLLRPVFCIELKIFKECSNRNHFNF